MKAGLWTQLPRDEQNLVDRLEDNFRRLDRSNIVADYDRGQLSLSTVTFPATQAPSADPNTLDDYEEGVWTPTLLLGGAAVGMTYGTRVGHYTKIGRIVHVVARVTLTALGSSTGNATITGLPFTNNSSVSVPLKLHSNALAAGITSPPWVAVPPSSAILSLIKFATGSASNMPETDFTNTSDLLLNGCYFVS